MKTIWSIITRPFRIKWKPQPKKEDVNAPFWLVVRLFFWLIFGAIILLSIPACGSPTTTPEVTTLTPEVWSTNPDTNETIYWSNSDVESKPWKNDDYYTLKSWYTLEDGYLQYHQGTYKIYYSNYTINTQEFRIR